MVHQRRSSVGRQGEVSPVTYKRMNGKGLWCDGKGDSGGILGNRVKLKTRNILLNIPETFTKIRVVRYFY